MKLLHSILISVILAYPALPAASAATVVIDSFTEGAFSISDSDNRAVSKLLLFGPANHRRVSVQGVNDWTSSVSTTAGELNYTVALRGSPAPFPQERLHLTYSRDSGFFELLGADAFAFNIVSIRGDGDIVFDTGSGNYPLLCINTVGEAIYPLSWTPWLAESEVGTFTFQIIARSSNFSVTFDQIAFVPEPSAVAVLLGSSVFLLRRRRAEA
jgi:hypothetical protein